MADKKIMLVKDEERNETREHNCRICSKVHPKYKCQFVCPHCNKKGHKAEKCWVKFPKLAPNYVPPPDPSAVKSRESTPGIKKKKRSRRSKSMGSDRGSDYEIDVESPADVRGRRRQRHKSNRVRTVEDDLMMGGSLHILEPLRHGGFLKKIYHL